MHGSPNAYFRFVNASVARGMGILIGLALVSLTGCRTTQSNAPVASLSETTVDPVSEVQTSATEETASLHDLERRWGIQILGLHLSAGGYMLDFRYRVLDPEKAAGLFVRSDKPYLIDQASGRKFLVPNPPKVGPLRTSYSPKPNRNYFVMFGNPGTFVKAGNKVTIVIGDFRVENLVVE